MVGATLDPQEQCVVIFRSLVFQILFYLSNAIQMIFWTPVFFFLDRPTAWKVVRLWAKSHLWLQAWIVGSSFEFRGTGNIPKGRPFLVASKHQSNWETYTTLLFFDDASFVLKRELMSIPLFGWYMSRMKLVPVDRGRRSEALASMAKNSAPQYREGRQIIIYPEGTRTSPGAPPAYKYGIVHLYGELQATVLPIALNSGLYWPRKSLMVYPGKIIMEFLPPIEPGLSREEFATELENRIETATDLLLAEAAAATGAPPTVGQYRKRRQEARP
jgi:1-acyl-sn-glycerol-3-phosphate acyltransferase